VVEKKKKYKVSQGGGSAAIDATPEEKIKASVIIVFFLKVSGSRRAI